ncbi:DUF5133 domain-containing protein [Streptomyces sp. NPDC048436]|uniref:DUF5133 domain-containing protein n=1 Tax=Streptomyces sp. NPDC048436 TaxID=3365550 RepID=UPI003714E150
MLMAHPTVLSSLVSEYEMLAALNVEDSNGGARRRMEDIGYTLCVSTGTQDVDAALVAARFRLPGARVHDDSLISAPMGRANAERAAG